MRREHCSPRSAPAASATPPTASSPPTPGKRPSPSSQLSCPRRRLSGSAEKRRRHLAPGSVFESAEGARSAPNSSVAGIIARTGQLLNGFSHQAKPATRNSDGRAITDSAARSAPRRRKPPPHPWAADICTRARARRASHSHATRVLGCAWSQIIWRLWHDHQPYDPLQHTALQHLITARG